ncbi:hypothetical protein AB0K48_59795, partial [Nonomuraea sp. NPDC055795]
GSKDKLVSLLDDFVARNNLKGYDIWDYDKLRILISRNEPIRRSYAAWITPGDVLQELIERISPARPDRRSLIARFLQKELVTDQFARLEQAGHSADEAIPLSQVFVDLPISKQPRPEHPQFTYAHGDEEAFVAAMIESSCLKYNGSGPPSNDHPGSLNNGRFVLIGGPGQGKTTLGQFACQIFRAALLVDADPTTISAEAESIIRVIKQQWEAQEIPKPAARRLPLRVVLSEFAASLSAKETNSVIEFLAAKFRKRTSSQFTDADMSILLREYPTFLVFDGLDEVPSATNRNEVLAAISDFWVDVAADDIDTLVVATSRPQGYNDDFSPKQYNHRYLIPLRSEIALLYGQKLARVRFGGDDDRYAKVVDRLSKAVGTPATARLMRSPLQVTILTLLVDRLGHPPEERWALFSEYYKLIYQRETERDIPTVRVLKEHATDVHAIHRRVGMLLQVE